jgi:hypothetical protein
VGVSKQPIRFISVDFLEEIEVTLGPSSLGRVILEGGVADGDTIALRDPAQSRRVPAAAPTSDANGAFP